MPEMISDNVFNWASMLDDKAREQALATARVAAIRGHIALMPDAHWGMGCTIGSVIPTQGAIIPSAVGVDIGCGVITTETNLSEQDLPDSLDGVLGSWQRTIPARLGYWHQDEDAAWRSFVADHGLPESIESDPKLRERAPATSGRSDRAITSSSCAATSGA